MRNLIFLFVYLLFPAGALLQAQLVESYYGHRRAGIDLMWFEPFKDAAGARTPWLFFSRNRASSDHNNRQSLFGSTSAVSCNTSSGWGVVAVGSFLNSGFTPKAGVQYARSKGHFLFFGWLVADLKPKGGADLFGMLRWQPEAVPGVRALVQAELFPVYVPSSGYKSFTGRLRLGPKYRTWSAGLMADYSKSGSETFVTTRNTGLFLRHEF